MLFIGAIIGLVAGAVQAAAGAAISTGLSAVGLGGRLAYGTYLNIVRAIVLLGRGAGTAGAAGGGFGGFGGGSFSGGGASGSWGGDTASNNQTPTPTPTNQAQTPNELPTSGASGTQITSGNDFMEGEYNPLEITSTRGNTTNWNNLGGIGTGIASGVHLMPQVEIIFPRSNATGRILNAGKVLNGAPSNNSVWNWATTTNPQKSWIPTDWKGTSMIIPYGSHPATTNDEDSLTWEEILEIVEENKDEFLRKAKEVLAAVKQLAPYLPLITPNPFLPMGTNFLVLTQIPQVNKLLNNLLQKLDELEADPVSEIMLAVFGEIPGFGDAVDILSGLLETRRGNVLGAALSFASAVPLLGSVPATARIGNAIRKALKKGKRFRSKFGKKLDAAYDRAKRAGKVFKGNKGGRYADLKVGPNQQRHHMPAQGSGVPKNNGGAIVMDSKDHQNTISWDDTYDAREFKQKQKQLLDTGRIKEAIDMDVKSIRDAFPDGRYEIAIQEMLQYYQSINVY